MQREAGSVPLLRVLSELRMPLVTAVAADRAAATMLSCSMLDVDTVATVGHVIVCAAEERLLETAAAMVPGFMKTPQGAKLRKTKVDIHWAAVNTGNETTAIYHALGGSGHRPLNIDGSRHCCQCRQETVVQQPAGCCAWSRPPP